MGRISLLLLGFAVILFAGCSTTPREGNRSEAHYFLGISYLEEQNPTLALKEFLLAAELDPGNADIQDALGQTFQLKGAYPEAEKHYLKALKLSKGDPQIQNNLAALYLTMQRWDEAIRLFRLASDNLLFTNQALALAGMGLAHFHKGEYLEAVSAFKKALVQNPRYAQAHLMLGETYAALDKLDLAIGEYRQALAVAPDYARVHYLLGMAYRRQGDNAKAAAAFRETVRIAPDSEYGGNAAEYLKLLP
ncbi:MAG: tetratricopeptide repeat protein [Desulfuromonadales bacterium]